MSQISAPTDAPTDEFTALVAPLRAELHAHCYRMLGSVHDAEDALQDALVRAWRARNSFEGRSSFRAWMYTIATRTCLDLIRRRGRRALPIDLSPASRGTDRIADPVADVAWLGPYAPLGGVGGDLDPAARYEQLEAVELAFVAALQHLSGNQRAALVLFDVVGFSAAEIASTMGTSVAAINSALERGRRVVDSKLARTSQQQELHALGDDAVGQLVEAFARAIQLGDADALVSLLSDDVTWSMPPLPSWYRGVTDVMAFALQGPLSSCGSWKYLPVTANGQAAVAFYLRPDDAGTHEAWSITVITVRDERIVELTSFLGGEHFAQFGLPQRHPDDDPGAA